jgi:hypothetical protein
MSTQETEAQPVLAWMAVLDRMQQTLGGSLAGSPEPPAGPAAPPAPQSPLRRLDDRLARLQGSLEQAERGAAEADALLAAEADTLQRWAELLAGARQTLAERAAGAVA